VKLIESPSPNFDERSRAIDTVILHYTGMKTGAEALARLCDPQAKVSAHYLVEEDGAIYRLVEERCRAWHAGVSSWQGEGDINARSIGIEIVNPGHEFGYRSFPPEQMASVKRLCLDILARHPIPAARVLGHSDVAPLRKEDPGEFFDWRGLATAGVGLWPESGSAAVLENAVGKALKRVGYGYTEEDLPAVIRAFQRRYRPANLTGTADAETRRRLAALLAVID
jgi:N-acetylmuramoyl-L-alanine amidase